LLRIEMMYRHLDREARQIRVIQLIKDPLHTPSVPLCYWTFKAKHVSLDSDDLPPYTALSYIWGERDPGRYKISLDGCILDITPNLHAAILTVSRLEDLTQQWLWIDAICINQDDLDERAFQVRLMRDLYSRGRRTIAYLGPKDDEVELGLEWLEILNEIISLPHKLLWLVAAAESPEHDPFWRSLNSIIENQWWSRAWIFQESILSPNLVFMWGKKLVPEKIVDGAFRLLEIMPYQNSRALLERGILAQGWSGPFNAVYKRFVNRYWYQERQRLTLGSIITQRYHLHASDPRDCVYALFSLVEQTDSRLADPNYAVPTWQTYASLVRAYTKVYDNIDILCLAGTPRKLKDLPSWAPDLAVRNEPDCSFNHEDSIWLMNLDAQASLEERKEKQESEEPHDFPLQPTSSKYFFRASGGNVHEVMFSEDLRALSSRAIYIDSIDGIAGHQHVVSTTTEFRTRTSFVAPSLQPKNTVSAYATAEATRGAIWRSMVLDRLAEFETEPAPDYAAALLVHGCINAETVGEDAMWRDVWNAMRNFLVAGTPLSDWLYRGADRAVIEIEAAEATKRHQERMQGRRSPKPSFRNPAIETCLHKLLEMQRHIFVTDEGYIGMAPLEARRGDEIWILSGCSIPILLRRLNVKCWQVVGECYIHGFMYGEVLELVNAGKRVTSTVILK
jgi:hypothetical protein